MNVELFENIMKDAAGAGECLKGRVKQVVDRKGKVEPPWLDENMKRG